VRVLEKIGMQRLGDADGQLIWQTGVGPATTR
jgi:hypothetical protein